MNEVIEHASERASSMSIITNDNYMDRVIKLADMMAGSKVTVPKHLQNSPGDCSAIIMQAMNWGLDPFVVAQKTHLVNGVLGYEAQLVNAVVQSSNSIKGAFSYEYKDEGGTAPNAFVSCRVGAVLNGQQDITWGEWLASASVTTKNSPLWKTNVKQQMAYLQVKNWARMYCPGAILGVYTAEELHDAPAAEQDVTSQGETLPPAKVFYSYTEFTQKLNSWVAIIESGKKTSDALISFIESKGTLFTDEQKAALKKFSVKSVVQEAEIVEENQESENDDFVNAYNESEAQ